MTSRVRISSMSPLSNVMTCMMKKLLLAAQLLLALTLTSCGNEDAPLTRQHASVMTTSGERIKLSVGFDNGEGSKARAMRRAAIALANIPIYAGALRRKGPVRPSLPMKLRSL